jgi:hypothetical protein
MQTLILHMQLNLLPNLNSGLILFISMDNAFWKGKENLCEEIITCHFRFLKKP